MGNELKTWLTLGQHLLRAAMVASSLPALSAGSAAASLPIDLNRADAATLARNLAGVGPAKAEAIVAYRQKHGPFKSVDELALVKGIGPRTLQRNRDRLIVKPPASRTVTADSAGNASTSSARQRARASPAD
jgi:competence protein ComEA